ncbi:MAG: hypothetical protein R2911_04940 [Caldilineaceae bacterium]
MGRIRAFEGIGHQADKVELLILGLGASQGIANGLCGAVWTP